MIMRADLWTAEQTADVASRQAGGVRLDVPHAPIWMQALAEKPLVDSGFVPEKFFDAWVCNHLTSSTYAAADWICQYNSMQHTSTDEWHTGCRPSTCIMTGARASSPTLMMAPASPGPSSLSGSSRTRACPLAPNCMGRLSLTLCIWCMPRSIPHDSKHFLFEDVLVRGSACHSQHGYTNGAYTVDILHGCVTVMKADGLNLYSIFLMKGFQGMK